MAAALLASRIQDNHTFNITQYNLSQGKCGTSSGKSLGKAAPGP